MPFMHCLVMGNNGASRTSGIRTICDMHLREVGVLSEDGSIEQRLEPGDLVFFRQEGDWLTKLIASLDGYWTHSGIYIGEGLIAHVHARGAGERELAKVATSYPYSVGVARLGVDASAKAKAVEWAREMVTRNDGKARYSGHNLGVAFALLLRARARGNWHRVPEPDDSFESLWVDDDYEGPAFTCSGFVFNCFAEGAHVELHIDPAPGLKVEGLKLYVPDEVTIYESIVGEGGDGEGWASGLEGGGRPSISAWVARADLVYNAVGGWMATVAADRSVPLDQGVTPGDLWCSPDVVQRWFLSPQHHAHALEASKDCPPSTLPRSRVAQ